MSGARLLAQRAAQVLDGELRSERLRAHAAGGEELVLGRRVEGPQAAEAAHVLEVERGVRLEVPAKARRPLPGLGTEHELAGHAQVDDRHGGAGVARGGRPAGGAAGLLLDSPRSPRAGTSRGGAAPSPGARRDSSFSSCSVCDAHRPVVDDDLSQQQAGQADEQPAPDGLDLGELRHRPPGAARHQSRRNARAPSASATSPASISSSSASSARPTVGPGLDAEQSHHVLAAQQLRRRRLAHTRPDGARQPVVSRHRGRATSSPPGWRAGRRARHDHDSKTQGLTSRR